MLAEIAFTSQALIAALAEADALVRAGSYGGDLVEVTRHAREVGVLLREAGERSGEEVDASTRAMANTLAAALESLDRQVQEPGSMH